jgi:hypothetical protein
MGRGMGRGMGTGMFEAGELLACCLRRRGQGKMHSRGE